MHEKGDKQKDIFKTFCCSWSILWQCFDKR